MRRLSIVAVALVTTLLMATPALAVDEVNTKRLRNAVTVGGILSHERVLQRIANQNGGTRASGTPGYEASADYVAGRLRAAGYTVTEQEFTFPFYQELSPAVLEQVSPTPTTYVTGTFDFSGTGDVTGGVVPTNDVVIPPTPAPSSTSGCEPGDFTPAPANEPAVALIQRGTCTFEDKANNAIAAGYDAVIIFNEGNPGREDLFIGTLGNPVRHPGGRSQLRRRRRPGRPDPGGRRGGRPRRHRDRDRPDPHDPQHHRRLPDRQRRPGGGRRRPPRLGDRRAGHQRQRQRLLHHPRDRRGDGRARHQEPPAGPLRVLGRRGAEPARLRALRQHPQRRRPRRRSWPT